MIEYRKATIGDAEALTRLRVEFLTENGDVSAEMGEMLRQNNRRYFTDALEDGSFAAWVAEEGDGIVATSGLTVYTLPPSKACPTGRTGYISNMYTLPAYRRQGIATKLFGLIMEEAARLGCERLLLHASDMGRGIYERFGFAVSERMMVYVTPLSG